MYALRRENGDVLYFDAVTDIEEQYTSTVTKHPIATGGYVSDHTIKDNKKFNLSAVLSDADFNLDRPTLASGIIGAADTGMIDNVYDDGGSYQMTPEGLYEYRPKQFQNNTPTKTTVKIESAKTESWKKFLPETVSQFTKTDIPTVIVEEQSKVKTAEAVRNELIQMWENKERFSLLEYRDNIVTRQWFNIVFTGLTFSQDADTGLGLFPVMQLEQVVFTDIERVAIRIRKTPNKGRKTGEVSKKPTEPGEDAENGPTQKSKQSALHRARTNAQG